METGIIIVIVILVVVIAVLIIALIAKESNEEKAETSANEAIKYLRDNCERSVKFLEPPGLYLDDNLPFVRRVERALIRGMRYKLESDCKIEELARLKNTQNKELRQWCIEQCKGYGPHSLKLAEDLFKYITTGKTENNE